MAYIIMLVFKNFVLHVVLLPDVLLIGTGFSLLMILKLDVASTAIPFYFRYRRFFSLQ